MISVSKEHWSWDETIIRSPAVLLFKQGNEIIFSKKKKLKIQHLAYQVASNNHSTNIWGNLGFSEPSEVNSWLVTIPGVK